MKTKKERNAVKEEALNERLPELTDDALRQVTGGNGGPGTLDRILSELAAWLNAHPNATKADVYGLLNEKKAEAADLLTDEELNALNELLDAFAS